MLVLCFSLWLAMTGEESKYLLICRNCHWGGGIVCSKQGPAGMGQLLGEGQYERGFRSSCPPLGEE